MVEQNQINLQVRQILSSIHALFLDPCGARQDQSTFVHQNLATRWRAPTTAIRQSELAPPLQLLDAAAWLFHAAGSRSQLGRDFGSGEWTEFGEQRWTDSG